MTTITIKGIPQDLYERLKQSAVQHRRSINSEAIVRLERSLGLRRLEADELLRKADEIRQRLSATPLTDELLKEVKSHGRP